MTLPFRRRHHDDEGGHERARRLISVELLEPLGDDEAALLAGHLSTCSDCRRDREAYVADHELLRSLRDRAPEPPRDLWARTAARLDREAGRRSRGRAPWRALPYGAAAGALIVVVVLGTSFIQPQIPPTVTAGSSQVAVATPVPPGPTPITIPGADPVGYVRTAADGSWALVFSDVDAVCPPSRLACRPLADGPGQVIKLDGKPDTMTVSPASDQLVIESAEGSEPGRILVVPVSTDVPPATQAPTMLPETAEPSVVTSSAEPTPLATPPGQLEIASGVTMVGDVAYSEDGTWLAFSAQPLDGSTGPDLYLWSVGQATATAVTTDHQTYFSAWFGNQVLASRIEPVEVPAASGDPSATDEPAATEEPATSAPPASDDPSATAAAGPTTAHVTSFLLDPATLARTDFLQPDVWLPVVDSSGRLVTYWSGTLQSTDGRAWQLDAGQLVLDRWSSGTGEPTEPPASAGATADPLESPDPVATAPPLGPAGAGIPIVTGQTAEFKTRFDPDGTRLAVWVAEHVGEDVGRLHLLVIDPETGTISAEPAPLPGVPALRRYSMDAGRLAWVSPSGQDGQESAVKVLGWSNGDFGEIETLPGRDLFIVR